MQKFDFTAPVSGTPQVVNAPGRYLKYTTGNAGGNDAGLIVTPGGKPGAKILLYPGQAITLPNDGTAGPNAWSIANALGQAPIIGTVVVGNGRLDDNALQGLVQVVDGGKARTLAGQAFAGAAFVNSGAGVSPYVQLWNPATNPNRLVLEQIEYDSSTTPLTGAMGFTQTQRTTMQQGVSKRSDGAQSVAICGYASVAYAAFAAMVRDFSLQANGTQMIKFSSPLVIMPGWGFELRANAAAAYLAANFEWYEEPNV
ncbi:hypothetical protein [Trinickia symbiotica]|uniref:Uncharacterized protein n=1 Tax=Trinickia symbiotica TaxID=863227 RepID=A0A2N7X9P5_9BURK|nr:hypothetical protein [Trinickia symbiotica]PMS38473.1 hypothetical protein C0Z20_00890 [Trinickia symbiotica]